MSAASIRLIRSLSARICFHFANHGLESGAVKDATFAIERVRHDSWTLKRPVEPSQDLTRKLGKGRLGDAVRLAGLD